VAGSGGLGGSKMKEGRDKDWAVYLFQTIIAIEFIFTTNGMGPR
jgi:hypothetical protein